jgi:hypothetical protein
MHYISGTSFAVKQHTNAWDSLFALNRTYRLVSITPLNGTVKYLFKGLDTIPTEIVFESCRQADLFIARHRKEILPDYEAVYKKASEAP